MEIELKNITVEEKARAWDALLRMTETRTANERPEFKAISKSLVIMMRAAVTMSAIFR